MKTKIKLFLFLALFGACQAWAQDAIRIIHGPYLQDVDEHQAAVVWVTDRPGVAWLEWAPDDSTDFYLKARPRVYDDVDGVKDIGQVHVVKLEGLKPGTRYRYRVYTQEVLSRRSNGYELIYGHVAASSAYRPYSFRTNDISKPTVSFAMMNDIHERPAVLGRMMELSKPLQRDLVLFNGDMVSWVTSEQQLFAGFMDTAAYVFAARVPMYYARGNHEPRRGFATHLHDYFSPTRPHLYYIFRQGPVCFVVLDSGEDKPDTDIEYSGIVDFDNYRTKEAQWLAEALKSKEFTEAPFKVVVCHMPPLHDWHGENEVLTKFVPLLNQAGVDLMLAAHLHRHWKMAPTSEVHFPVLINSNNNVLTGDATAHKLSIQVTNQEGKEVDSLVINK
ncbi:MAG: metallophosphoesterase [Tannerella sp.]|jgi:hypothetical protein|nr:metallophosphoesterase [Tannerella sp.]